MNENLVPLSTVKRITKNNFIGHGWEKDQVNTVGGSQVTTPTTDHVKIECAPLNTDEPGINKGAVLLSLPKTIDPSLRRVRLRNTLYNDLKLSDIDVLSVFTYIVANINDSAPSIALQISLNDNGNLSDFNIFYDPREQHAHNSRFPVVMKNKWQQWDLLTGVWQLFNTTRPELPGTHFTLQTFLNIAAFQNARIVNTTLGANSGGGIRFTIGGNTNEYDDFKGYVDAFIVGRKQDEKPTLYDFVCDQSNQ